MPPSPAAQTLATLVRPTRQHVEGTVLAMLSLVVVGHRGTGTSIGEVAAATAFTIGVYWIANVYADVMSRPHVSDTAPPSLRRLVTSGMVEEFALVTPGILLLGTTTLAYALGASLATSLWLMLILGNVTLFAWGWVTARRYDTSIMTRFAFATTGALIGLLVIAGKLLLH